MRVDAKFCFMSWWWAHEPWQLMSPATRTIWSWAGEVSLPILLHHAAVCTTVWTLYTTLCWRSNYHLSSTITTLQLLQHTQTTSSFNNRLPKYFTPLALIHDSLSFVASRQIFCYKLQPSHHTSHVTPGCLLWWQSRNCGIVKTGSVATLCPAFKPYPLLGCKVLKSNVQWLFRLFYDNI